MGLLLAPLGVLLPRRRGAAVGHRPIRHAVARGGARQYGIAMREALTIVFRREHLRRTLKIAFIVGCLLTTINQFDVFLDGRENAITFVKVVLNFCVPFCVSNLGLLAGKKAEKEALAAYASEAAAPGR